MQLLTKIRQAVQALATRRVTVFSDSIPYEFRDLPLRKVINAILTETSVYFKPQRPWGQPTHLMVEPSTLCNLRCSLCPITTGLERPQGLMELDLFKKILDDVGPWVFTLQLWDWGEPFVNAQIFDMIAYARNKGVKVISSSNGHLFAKPGMAEKLVRSGTSSLPSTVSRRRHTSFTVKRGNSKPRWKVFARWWLPRKRLVHPRQLSTSALS